MSHDCQKKSLVIFSACIIMVDLIEQVVGWVFIIGVDIYKTQSCSYHLYSFQCCPAVEDIEGDCFKAQSIKPFFLTCVVGPLISYFICIGLYYFLSKKNKMIAQAILFLSLVMFDFISLIYFFEIARDISEFPKDSHINRDFRNASIFLGVLCIVKVILSFVTAYFFCEVAQHSQIVENLNQQHIQTLVPNSDNQRYTDGQPYFDQLIQAQYVQSQQQQKVLQTIIELSIHIQPLQGLQIDQQSVPGQLEQFHPITLQPIVGLAIKN